MITSLGNVEMSSTLQKMSLKNKRLETRVEEKRFTSQLFIFFIGEIRSPLISAGKLINNCRVIQTIENKMTVKKKECKKIKYSF